jgi:hypothetical protein
MRQRGHRWDGDNLLNDARNVAIPWNRKKPAAFVI